MDFQDLQDDRRSDLLDGEITGKIIGVCSKSSMSWEVDFVKSSCTSCPSMSISAPVDIQCRQYSPFRHLDSNRRAAAWLALVVWFTLATSSYAFPQGFSKEFDGAIQAAFQQSHDGWSVDEVLLDDDRRKRFLTACRAQSELKPPSVADSALLERLVQIRKSGKLDIKATKRANPRDGADVNDWLPVAEIASRLMQDRFEANIDQWLVNPDLLKEFDTIVSEIVPDADRYAPRKAALTLRKSRRLQPELLTRVTDWKREIQIATVADMAARLSTLPTNAGIYIFRDKTGFLYIGQSNNLRTRLSKHLDKSDRKSLARYLEAENKEEISVELHIFAADSPAAVTVVREAYESDLIRTRKPRLNVAP